MSIQFTNYQIGKKWNEFSVENLDFHGWSVKEGRFGSVVAVYSTKEECDKWMAEYKKINLMDKIFNEIDSGRLEL